MDESDSLPRLVVGPSAAAQFRTISEAVAAAQADGTILIEPGIYQEALRIDKPLRLVALETIATSAGPTVTIQTAIGSALTVEVGQDAGDVFLEGVRLTTLAQKPAVEVLAGSTLVAKQCHFGPSGVSGIRVDSLGRLILAQCQIEETAGIGIELLGSRRAILQRLLVQQTGGAGISLSQNASANLSGSQFLQTAGGAWQVTPGCHLLLEQTTRDVSLPVVNRAECPCCQEPVTLATNFPTTALCPVCGWCFGLDSAGEIHSPPPIEVRCRVDACQQVFPAAAAGTDLCCECLAEFSWDSYGNPARTDCPSCSAYIPLTGSPTITCAACGCQLIVDDLGNFLGFGEWDTA